MSIGNKRLTILSIIAAAMLLYTGTVAAQCPTLVWSDEFDGNAVNTANWEFQTGGTGWGNNEWQYYRPENATVSGGALKITAKEENYRGKSYTSTRMRTINKADFYYGRFEARIKLPTGQGIWPAFWMMPTDDVYGGWPSSGEIDIMEHLGHELSTTYGTLHYGASPSAHAFSGSPFNLFGENFKDGWHVFAVEKDPNEIRWYVDDILYLTQTPDTIAPEFWPFEERFHFILNLAVGGNWPGYPDETTVFPQVLEVDYVRVYSSNFPSIGGDRKVPSQSNGQIYSIAGAPAGTAYTWTVPSGATIVSGQGTDAITVDWGLTGGEVAVSLNNACGTTLLTIPVLVEPPYNYDFSFENFDTVSAMTLTLASGTLTEITNPDTSGVNSSALSGEYVRSAAELYDVIVYATSDVPNAGEYVTGQRKLYLDLYTTAPVGTELLVQFEDSTVTTPDNYPTGRHSRYQAFTGVQNAWERIEVGYLDRPDAGTADTAVDSIIILFAPNGNTSDTFIYDNFDSYLAVDVGGTPPAAPSGLTATASGSSTIDLAWTDNSSDETSFKVERSPDGVNFTLIGATTADMGAYFDSGLQSNTTYYYRVLASNSSGDSGYTNVANATTDEIIPGDTMHVSSVFAAILNAGKGQKRGSVTVTVVDDLGAPIQGATVSGNFSGSYNESGSGITGADGSVQIDTAATAAGGVTLTFCVTDVTHVTLTYDTSANVETCGSL